MDYRYGSHTVYNIGYRFVWVTKYRDQILKGWANDKRNDNEFSGSSF